MEKQFNTNQKNFFKSRKDIKEVSENLEDDNENENKSEKSEENIKINDNNENENIINDFEDLELSKDRSEKNTNWRIESMSNNNTKRWFYYK